MSVTTFCLGGCCVFSGISPHLAESFGLLQCVSRLCLKVGGKKKKKKAGRWKGGTKCSSVPKTHHLLEVCVVFMALVLECKDDEWMVCQS